ncbi:hypothetical protein KFE25_009155 [Diacronema lutheri]|uniref:Cytosol aminopeptidase domain-containing protein n=2 Tax=Diacronema lutheri TaxID=2081491 RepID=A0A8J5Y4F8_DIALT|nr:hypothetical protein KFE25_009155 [Diacronema lutheri]
MAVMAVMMLSCALRIHKPLTLAAWRGASALMPARVGASPLRGGVGRAAMSTSAAPSTRDLVRTALTTPAADVSISTAATGASDWTGDLLVVLIPQTQSDEALHAELNAELGALDAKLDGTLAAVIVDEAFKGKAGESKVLTLPRKYGLKKVAIIGTGKPPTDPAAPPVGTGAKWGATLASIAKAEKAASAAVALPPGTSAAEVQAAVEALYLGVVSDDRFKDLHADALKTADERMLKLKSVQLLMQPSADTAAALGRALALARGVMLTKALVNAPANYITPTTLALTASRLAADHGLAVEVLEREQCEALGMGSYLGVSQGASEPPKFIHLSYKPKGAVSRRIALVGKGLTFDSGGYNIKAGPGSMIEKMKFDMGGAAAVLGAAQVVGELKPAGIEVHFIVAACENMVSERAMRPGDILTASNGKTIEVLNTDAEGRLTLADALVFAEKLGGAPDGPPALDAIVDVATLTGAVIIALGDKYAGLWASSDKLSSAISSAAASTGELIWRMPLAAEYGDQLKSPIADLKNVGGRGGSSISAALFLKEFVKSAPWAHMDIAGTVWDDKTNAPTGYGVRTLYRLVEEAPKTDFK